MWDFSRDNSEAGGFVPAPEAQSRHSGNDVSSAAQSRDLPSAAQSREEPPLGAHTFELPIGGHSREMPLAPPTGYSREMPLAGASRDMPAGGREDMHAGMLLEPTAPSAASTGPTGNGGTVVGALLDTLPVLGAGGRGSDFPLPASPASSSSRGSEWADEPLTGHPGSAHPLPATPPPRKVLAAAVDSTPWTAGSVPSEGIMEANPVPESPAHMLHLQDDAAWAGAPPATSPTDAPTEATEHNPLADWVAGIGAYFFNQEEEETPAYPQGGQEVHTAEVRFTEPSFGSGDATTPWAPRPPESGGAELGNPNGPGSTRGAGVGRLDHQETGLSKASQYNKKGVHWSGEEDHDGDLMGRSVSRTVTFYTKSLPANRPCACSCCGFILVMATIGLTMPFLGLEVETDFASFMKTDVNSSVMHDGFKAALSVRGGSVVKDRRLREAMAAVLYQHFDVFLNYELKEGSDERAIFSPKVLGEIAKFETKLTNSPEWVEYCDTVDIAEKSFCTSGISIANYALPSLDIREDDVVPSGMEFDGRGKDQIPIETTIKLLEQFELQDLIFPTGFGKTPTDERPVVRSAYRFKFYCCTSLDPTKFQRDEVNRMTEIHRAWLSNFFLPFMATYTPGSELNEPLPFDVYFNGHKMKEIEVMEALMKDVTLSGGSIIFVLFYVMCHTRSLFLSVAGLALILLSIPLSYVLFALCTGATKLSVASFLSLFLVVGLGSDVIFVYTDFWKDSARHHSNIGNRFLWTQKHAGKASLATSATTALSFFANLASVLRPLREFGTFMGLCVITCWALITLIFLPLCIVDERLFNGYRRRCCGGGNGSGESSWSLSAVLVKWESILCRWKLTSLLSFVLIALVALFFAASNAATDTSGLPNLFPKNHNQGHGKEVMDRFLPPHDVFGPQADMPVSREEVCQEYGFRPGDIGCVLFWCEADKKIPKSEGDKCHCYRREDPTSQICDTSKWAIGVTRFIGRDTISQEALMGPVAKQMEWETNLALQGVHEFKVSKLAPMLVQEWTSGTIDYRPLLEVKATAYRKHPNASCGFQEVCFCGTHVCHLPKPQYKLVTRPMVLHPDHRDRRMAEPVLNSSDMVLHSNYRGRRLGEPVIDPDFNTLPSNKRADIAVVFGIKVSEGAPLLGEKAPEDVWKFLDTFDVSQPWAQRQLYNLCMEPSPALRVSFSNCWIKDFHKWLGEKNERFPVQASRFDNLMLQFLQVGLTGFSSTKEFLWIEDGKVKASFMQFFCDFSSTSGVEAVMSYQEQWTIFVNAYNAQASRFARGAFHTSQLWVRAEAQKELISSTVLTLLIVLVLAFAAMLVFTFDAMLSFLVVMSTLGVISGLAFFIVCVMQWAIGPIEVIALIVFIGYAVTYSLHITHKYGDPEALEWSPPYAGCKDMDDRAFARYQRTGFALKSIGGAALGSAITTCGCSVFLLSCTLAIFQKLGGVVLAVTLMSILTALGPLPAALLVCGPLRPGHRCRGSPPQHAPPQDEVCECGGILTANAVFCSKCGKKVNEVRPRAGTGTSLASCRSTRTAETGLTALWSPPAPPKPGDGVILASAVVALDARSRRPSWPEYQTTPFKEYTTAGSPPSTYTGTAATPVTRDSPVSPTTIESVHIDISDGDYGNISDERALTPPPAAPTRTRMTFTSRATSNKSPRRPRGRE